MAIDKEAIKEHIRGILVALGDDPNREGLKETPDRVAKMYEEVFEGMNYSNHEIAQMFSKTFEDDLSVKDHKDMVIVKDIDIKDMMPFEIHVQGYLVQSTEGINAAKRQGIRT